MGQPSPPRPELGGEGDGFSDRKVTPVGLWLEPVEDQGVDPGEETLALGMQILRVGQVGEEAGAAHREKEADRFHLAVGDRQRGHLEVADLEGTADGVRGGFEIAAVAIFAVEDVGESRLEPVEALRGGVDRDLVILHHGEATQVVEAHDVVAVGVGVEDRVEMADALAQALLAEVGTGVDDELGPGAADKNRGAEPPVPGVVRAADGAVAADHGHPDRGARAEKGDFRPRFHCVSWPTAP